MKHIMRNRTMRAIVIAAILIAFGTIPVLAGSPSKTCYVDGCTSLREGSSSYCRKHKCAEKGCAAKRANGSYCSFHQATLCGTSGKDGFNSTVYTKCAYSGCRTRVVSGGKYCSSHTCCKSGCINKRESGSNYCSAHKDTNKKPAASTSKTGSASGVNISKKKSQSSTKKKYDRYDVYDYKDAESFADDKYEDFFEEEDDYEDEDEAYDDAVEYWERHHR